MALVSPLMPVPSFNSDQLLDYARCTTGSRVCHNKPVVTVPAQYSIVARYCSGQGGDGLGINRSRVRLPATALPGSDPGKSFTHVLSASEVLRLCAIEIQLIQLKKYLLGRTVVQTPAWSPVYSRYFLGRRRRFTSLLCDRQQFVKFRGRCANNLPGTHEQNCLQPTFRFCIMYNWLIMPPLPRRGHVAIMLSDVCLLRTSGIN